MGRVRQTFGLLAVWATLFLPVTASGGTDTWRGPADGWFHDGSSWTDGSVPTSKDTVLFDVDWAYEVWWDATTADRTTQSLSVSAGKVAFRVSDSPSSPYTWTITDPASQADALITAASLTLGLPGFTGNLILGVDDALEIDGGGMLGVGLGNEVRSGTVTVGATGAGTLAIGSGGRVTNTQSGSVAPSSGTFGTVVITDADSAWQVAENLYLGGTAVADGGDASLDLISGGRLYVGDIAPATVTAPSSTDSAVVVSDGAGRTLLLRNGATLNNDGHAYLGYNATETGTATVLGAGTSWTNDGDLTVGLSGKGVLNLTGDASVQNHDGFRWFYRRSQCGQGYSHR